MATSKGKIGRKNSEKIYFPQRMAKGYNVSDVTSKHTFLFHLRSISFHVGTTVIKHRIEIGQILDRWFRFFHTATTVSFKQICDAEIDRGGYQHDTRQLQNLSHRYCGLGVAVSWWLKNPKSPPRLSDRRCIKTCEQCSKRHILYVSRSCPFRPNSCSQPSNLVCYRNLLQPLETVFNHQFHYLRILLKLDKAKEQQFSLLSLRNVDLISVLYRNQHGLSFH